jgi:hypothetical protein
MCKQKKMHLDSAPFILLPSYFREEREEKEHVEFLKHTQSEESGYLFSQCFDNVSKEINPYWLYHKRVAVTGWHEDTFLCFFNSHTHPQPFCSDNDLEEEVCK